MRRLLFLLLLLAVAGRVQARSAAVGLDAFNRVLPVSATNAAAFSPLSFEIDCVGFAEAVDPIRRAKFASTLHVMDEFSAEYGPLARLPFAAAETNGYHLMWAHALVVDEPRRIDPNFRSTVQDLYGIEVCRMQRFRGVEAWVKALFSGDFDGWRLPQLPKGNVYAFHDLVSVSITAVSTNGWKRDCATHFVYRVPLAGGSDFYAVVPKPGRPVSSVRARLTSVTLPEILSMSSAIVDPPVPTRLVLPAVDIVSTNELTGAFSYFNLPTTALKPFPPLLKPVSLRQTMRFQIRTRPSEGEAERLEGPFLFFIHDPIVNTIPAVGVIPGKGEKS